MEPFQYKDEDSGSEEERSDAGQESSDESIGYLEDDDECDYHSTVTNSNGLNNNVAANLSERTTTQAQTTISTSDRSWYFSLNRKLSAVSQDCEDEFFLPLNSDQKQMSFLYSPPGTADDFRFVCPENLFEVDETSSVDFEDNDNASYASTDFSDEEMELPEAAEVINDNFESMLSEKLSCMTKTCGSNAFANYSVINIDESIVDADEEIDDNNIMSADGVCGRKNSVWNASNAIRNQGYIFNPQALGLPCLSRDSDTESVDCISTDEESEEEYYQPRIISEDYVSPRRQRPQENIFLDENYTQNSSEAEYEERFVNARITPRARPLAPTSSALQARMRMNRRRLFTNDESTDTMVVDDLRQRTIFTGQPNNTEDPSGTERRSLQ